MSRNSHRDHVGRDVLHRAGTDVEEQFLAIAEFDQEASCRLAVAVTGRRHACAAGSDADLLLGKRLGAGVVDVAIRRYTSRVCHYTAGRKYAKRQEKQD